MFLQYHSYMRPFGKSLEIQTFSWLECSTELPVSRTVDSICEGLWELNVLLQTWSVEAAVEPNICSTVTVKVHYYSCEWAFYPSAQYYLSPFFLFQSSPFRYFLTETLFNPKKRKQKERKQQRQKNKTKINMHYIQKNKISNNLKLYIHKKKKAKMWGLNG